MRKYSGIPELLEQFMTEQGCEERWVTVKELRDRFCLTRYQCNTVSGFLRRLEFTAFGRFPYIVVKIEHLRPLHPSDPPQCRYLVRHNGRSARDTGCNGTTPEACSHGAAVHSISVTVTDELEAGRRGRSRDCPGSTRGNPLMKTNIP